MATCGLVRLNPRDREMENDSVNELICRKLTRAETDGESLIGGREIQIGGNAVQIRMEDQCKIS
jgi:hypothetical protein